MKLILENWRRYLKEQHEDDFDDDEGDDNGDFPKTPAGKITSLLMTGDAEYGVQARDFILQGLADIDEVLDILIEHLLRKEYQLGQMAEFYNIINNLAAKSFAGFLEYNPDDDISKKNALYRAFNYLLFSKPNKEDRPSDDLKRIDRIREDLKKDWEKSLE